MVCFLTASFVVDRRTILLEDYRILIYWKITIRLLVIFSCTLSVLKVRHDIVLMSSAFSMEGTWTEATHDRVLAMNSGGLRGITFVFSKSIPDDVSGGHSKGIPCLYQYHVNVGSCKFCAPILQNPGRLEVVVKVLKNFHLAHCCWTGYYQSRLTPERMLGCCGYPENEGHVH